MVVVTSGDAVCAERLAVSEPSAARDSGSAKIPLASGWPARLDEVGRVAGVAGWVAPGRRPEAGRAAPRGVDLLASAVAAESAGARFFPVTSALLGSASNSALARLNHCADVWRKSSLTASAMPTAASAIRSSTMTIFRLRPRGRRKPGGLNNASGSAGPKSAAGGEA